MYTPQAVLVQLPSKKEERFLCLPIANFPTEWCCFENKPYIYQFCVCFFPLLKNSLPLSFFDLPTRK